MQHILWSSKDVVPRDQVLLRSARSNRAQPCHIVLSYKLQLCFGTIRVADGVLTQERFLTFQKYSVSCKWLNKYSTLQKSEFLCISSKSSGTKASRPISRVKAGAFKPNGRLLSVSVLMLLEYISNSTVKWHFVIWVSINKKYIRIIGLGLMDRCKDTFRKQCWHCTKQNITAR